MSNDQVMMKVENLSKWYEQRNDKILWQREKLIVKAVDKVSFDLKKGEVLGIIGESGCGKSTLGRILLRLEEPTWGEVRINEKSSAQLMKEEKKKFRKMVQIIFQNPFDTFPPRHNISKIMVRALKIHHIGSSDEERYQMCVETMNQAGLHPAEDFLSRHPHELSGGQLQRISILRAMMLEPLILVADEPVSMLDVSVRAEIINMLTELTADEKTSMIFISHDIAVTRYISQRIIVMYLGRIVEMGNTEDIIHNPQHPYTQVLISNCASIDFLDEELPIKIEGEPPTPVNPGPGCYFAERCPYAEKICFEIYPEEKIMAGERRVSCHKV